MHHQFFVRLTVIMEIGGSLKTSLKENNFQLRRVCTWYNLRVIFKSGQMLRTMLTRVKDRLPEEKHSKVVYRIPCDCGRVYIGETIRRLETRLKEHKEAHRKADTETSAVAEHSWNTQHAIQWGETTILDQARRTKELKIKEALHILMTPSHQRLNRDEGLELPGCWTATMRQMGGGPDSTSGPTPGTRVSSQYGASL